MEYSIFTVSLTVITLQSCHSGPPITTFEGRLDPESSLFNLDSRFRGNDDIRTIVNLLLRHYTSISY